MYHCVQAVRGCRDESPAQRCDQRPRSGGAAALIAWREPPIPAGGGVLDPGPQTFLIRCSRAGFGLRLCQMDLFQVVPADIFPRVKFSSTQRAIFKCFTISTSRRRPEDRYEIRRLFGLVPSAYVAQSLAGNSHRDPIRRLQRGQRFSDANILKREERQQQRQQQRQRQEHQKKQFSPCPI